MARRRKPVNRPVDPRDWGTPETLAKLEPDPLLVLVEAGLIDASAQSAAEEIKRVYLAVVRAALAGIGRYGEYVQGRYEISAELAAAHAQRYKPWANAQGPRLEWVIDIVVDRRRVSPHHQEHVIRALDGYARMMRIPLDICEAV